ncbi:Uncharacterized protein APZ42_013782 [Daphnia magna]|uniref:Uncharacterized protein n=1 Tax=Daphnia magna TaxID=35525 RepID=A0A162QHY3_9CRUS|nr:Uncharacterized protein APZ42_013782 [Daphnia magna]
MLYLIKRDVRHVWPSIKDACSSILSVAPLVFGNCLTLIPLPL